MRVRGTSGSPTPRSSRGVAAVEMAILLPVLTFLLVVTVDFARLFYHLTVINNCARNGALYARDPQNQVQSPYYNKNQTTGIQNAALADSKRSDGTSLLNPALTASDVTSTSGTDVNGNAYVEVTVAHDFHMIISYLGFSTVRLSRTVRMETVPFF